MFSEIGTKVYTNQERDVPEFLIEFSDRLLFTEFFEIFLSSLTLLKYLEFRFKVKIVEILLLIIID